MRHIIIPDDSVSSSSELSSSDEQKKTQLNFLQWAIKKIVISENKVDKRLVGVHIANQASLRGTTIDIEGTGTRI